MGTEGYRHFGTMEARVKRKSPRCSTGHGTAFYQRRSAFRVVRVAIRADGTMYGVVFSELRRMKPTTACMSEREVNQRHRDIDRGRRKRDAAGTFGGIMGVIGDKLRQMKALGGMRTDRAK